MATSNSSNVTIDLTNYKDKVGSRVPEGRYKVVVEDIELDKSAAGNQMINVWLRVSGGDQDGAVIIDRLVLTEKSLFRVVGFMSAIGLPTPKKRLQVNVISWKGRTLLVDVADGEPYNGRVKSEVRGYERAKSDANSQPILMEVEDAAPVTAQADPTEGMVESVEPLPDVVDLDDLKL